MSRIKRLSHAATICVARFFSKTEVRFDICGAWGQEQLLVGTFHGLLLVSQSFVRRIYWGDIYGITVHEGRIYFLSRMNDGVRRYAQIVSGILNKIRLIDVRIEITDIDYEGHQIDFIGRSLFITETSRNRISIYRLQNGSLDLHSNSYPRGQLDAGAASRNYVHMNSVYAHPSGLYLMYHNCGDKTGRLSELVKLHQTDLSEIETRSVRGICAHNIIFDEGEFLFCDSFRCRLMHGNEIVFQAKKFLRGLARTSSYTFVGGSVFGARSQREPGGGAEIFRIENSTRSSTGSIQIAGVGAIREIRIISETDIGLSNYAKQQ